MSRTYNHRCDVCYLKINADGVCIYCKREIIEKLHGADTSNAILDQAISEPRLAHEQGIDPYVHTYNGTRRRLKHFNEAAG